LRVSCNLDSTTRLLYLSTFEKSNLQPYVSYNETDPDAEMKALLNIEKNFLVATKKVNEKLYFNIILSIYNKILKIYSNKYVKKLISFGFFYFNFIG
jgi:hypothetical protein